MPMVPAEYRELAKESLRLAQRAKSPDNRQTMLGIARQWLQLAGPSVETQELLAEIDALQGPVV